MIGEQHWNISLSGLKALLNRFLLGNFVYSLVKLKITSHIISYLKKFKQIQIRILRYI